MQIHPDLSMENHTAITKWISEILAGKAETCKLDVLPATVEEITACSELEGTTPLLHRAIANYAIQTRISRKLTEKLKLFSVNQVARELAHRHEFEEIVAEFNQKALRFIVLKGEALANRYYEQPYMRTRSDIDLLFENKDHAERAWTTLESRGYSRKLTLDGKFVGFQFSCGKVVPGGSQINLDIHNKLNDYLWIANKFSFEEVSYDFVLLTYGKQTIKTPNSVFLVIHACLHRINNRPIHIEDRLIWLYDIHLVCKSLSQADWETLINLAKEKNIIAFISDGVLQARDAFNTAIPQQIMDELKSAAQKEKSALGMSRKRAVLYLQDFLLLKGIGNKICFIREHLFPSRQYMRKKYPQARCWNLPFYYLKRPFEGIKKYL